MAITDNDDENESLLLYEISRQQRTCFDRRAQHLKLTRSQWHALGILRRNPGIRQSKMAEMMEVEPITLVRLLDRMEKAGWIKREQDPKDRRANCLMLTDKVRGIVEQMIRISLGLRGDTLKNFSEAERLQLLAYLKRIKQNISEALCKETSNTCSNDN